MGERGSSPDRETFREEDMPDGEDDSEAREEVGVDEAREASSRESRGRRDWVVGEVKEEYVGARDMTRRCGSLVKTLNCLRCHDNINP